MPTPGRMFQVTFYKLVLNNLVALDLTRITITIDSFLQIIFM